MAFKDLEKYYQKTKQNYFSVLKHLDEFDKAHKEGVLKDKKFKRFTEHLDTLRQTYEIVSCFFMIWAKPSEEEKIKLDSLKDGEKYDYLKERDPDRLLKEQDDIIKDINKYLEKKNKDGK